ncbi:MAG: ABC transporter permease [Ktedonobacterales bacterium]
MSTRPASSITAAQAGQATDAAPITQMVLAQTRAELVMSLRQGERLLATLILPALLLIFFAKLAPGIIPSVDGKPINFLLPGVLAAAIISNGMVSLGIATAYDRHYGVLKRLGSSPLPRWGLLVAKVLSVFAVEVGQIIVLMVLAAFFGWRPDGSILAALLVILLGTSVFAGLGMLMAGALRAEATLAAANGLYLVFLGIGGIFVPLTPERVGFFAVPLNLLPPAALSNALRGALTSQGVPVGSLILLVVWAAIILGAAAFTFKWE